MDRWVESTRVGSSTHSTITLTKAYLILMYLSAYAMKNSDQPPLDESNGSGSDHNTPPKLLGSEDTYAVVKLMIPSSQPTTPAVILNKAARCSAKIEALERLVEEKRGLTLQKRWKYYVLLKHR
jgi:hypothetical protein